MNTTTPELLELQRLSARANVLNTVIKSRKSQTEMALKAKVNALPTMLGVQNLAQVINIIREVGEVRTRADIDDKKRARILSQITSGQFTPKQIAEMNGVSIPSVHVIRQNAGIKAKRGRPVTRTAA